MGRIPAGQPVGCSNFLPANLSGGLRRYDPIATLSLITRFVSSLRQYEYPACPLSARNLFAA